MGQRKIPLVTLLVYQNGGRREATAHETEVEQRAAELYAAGAESVMAIGPRLYGLVPRLSAASPDDEKARRGLDTPGG